MIDETALLLLTEMAKWLDVDQSYGRVPSFDSKRPFGNSGDERIALDIARILGYAPRFLDHGELAPEFGQDMHAILERCGPALQALLSTPYLAQHLRQPLRCLSCWGPVEESRHCYYTPTCYACLPPPEPLGVIPCPTLDHTEIL